jgi:hypothetical protein
MTDMYVTGHPSQVTDRNLCLQIGGIEVSGIIFRDARKVKGEYYL